MNLNPDMSLEEQVAERLNELGIPVVSFNDMLGQVIAKWMDEGGTLVVRKIGNGELAISLNQKPQNSC